MIYIRTLTLEGQTRELAVPLVESAFKAIGFANVHDRIVRREEVLALRFFPLRRDTEPTERSPTVLM